MRISHSQNIINRVKETIDNRVLIDPADKLLIGISGGKDSLTLLDCLFRAGYKALHSIHVQIDKTVSNDFYSFCAGRSDFKVIETDILTEMKQNRRKNHCYICSRARRKAICQYAVDNGFNKLVFAHHKNDAVETMLLNIMFQREFSTMLPGQVLFNGKLKIVRPLYDISEKEISRYARLEKLPVSKWKCGFEETSRRNWIREQIHLWQKAFPKVDIVENMFSSMGNVNTDFLINYKISSKRQVGGKK